MRKVFVSTVAVQNIERSYGESDDYDLQGGKYHNPIAYMTKNNVEDGDDVLIITMMNDGEQPEKNMVQLQEELKESLEDKEITLKFEKIVLPQSAFDRDTMYNIFRKIVSYIQDDDHIYADITYGIKPMTMSIIVALNYVNNVFKNIEIEELVYGELYKGAKNITNYQNACNIFDVSTLFYLNGIAGKAENKNKDELDEILNYVI